MSFHDLALVVSGSVLLGYGVAGVFFWRYWRQTRERLFGLFAAAFFILAIDRVLLIASIRGSSGEPHFYVMRLIAYAIIIWAIWDRNRR
jgi:hypothetical protein